MKRLFCLLFFCMACLSAGAQWKWQNPMDAGFPVVQNQGWPDEIGYKYVRLDVYKRQNDNRAVYFNVTNRWDNAISGSAMDWNTSSVYVRCVRDM